jgi:hypothetical protein
MRTMAATPAGLLKKLFPPSGCASGVGAACASARLESGAAASYAAAAAASVGFPGTAGRGPAAAGTENVSPSASTRATDTVLLVHEGKVRLTVSSSIDRAWT